MSHTVFEIAEVEQSEARELMPAHLSSLHEATNCLPGNECAGVESVDET
jgi:hypothetical protein